MHKCTLRFKSETTLEKWEKEDSFIISQGPEKEYVEHNGI